MEKLERYFEDRLKTGVVLSVAQMRAWCRRKKLTVPKTKDLEGIRLKFKAAVQYAGIRKPAHLMSNAGGKYGCVQIDYAKYGYDAKSRYANGGMSGFLLGVETKTTKVAIIPTKDATAKSWERAIREMCEVHFDAVNVLQSDRDVVATSRHFREKLKNDLSVEIQYLPLRGKAYLAELMIRWSKAALSRAKLASGGLAWVPHVPGVMRHLNSGFVPGTTIRKNDVSKENYLQIDAEKFSTEDPDLLINLATSSHHSEKTRKAIFKYQMNDVVALSRHVNIRKGQRTGTFFKPSVEGSWGTTELYRISKMVIRNSRDRYLVPVYGLVTLDGSKLPSLYYESEIKKVSFPPPAADNDDRRRAS